VSLIDQIRSLRGDEQKLEEKSSRYPNGRGTYKRGEKSVSRKSKVPNYSTIKDALKKTKPGTIFSTKGSYRLYVTTSGGWGKSKQQRVSGRTAKGFTPGSSTPGSDWKSIKSHAARTSVKHGGAGAKSLTAKARREADKPKKYKAKAKRSK
jgi:hypothetical protein